MPPPCFARFLSPAARGRDRYSQGRIGTLLQYQAKRVAASIGEAAGPDRSAALVLVDAVHDAGPQVAAGNVVAVDHLVEPPDCLAGGARAVPRDHVARDAFNLGLVADHAACPHARDRIIPTRTAGASIPVP